jgi:MORN repeat
VPNTKNIVQHIPQADMRFYNSSERQPYCTGDSYNGEWRANMKEGYGTKTWVSGNKYEGEWCADMRHGKGTLWVAEDGCLRKRYAGDWFSDKRQGVGVYFYQDGER